MIQISCTRRILQSVALVTGADSATAFDQISLGEAANRISFVDIAGLLFDEACGIGHWIDVD